MDENSEPLTMKKLDARIDRIEEELGRILEDRDGRSGSSMEDGLLEEIRLLRHTEDEANRRRSTMTRTCIARTLMDVMLALAITALMISCAFVPDGQEIMVQDLRDSKWLCTETMVGGLAVFGIEFDKTGKSGSILTSGRNGTKPVAFQTEGNLMTMGFPEMEWDFVTDYESFLTIDHDGQEITFVKSVF